MMVAPPAPLTISHLLYHEPAYNPLDWVPITHAGQDRQRADGAQRPAGEHAPGADRLRPGQSRQAHVRDARPGSTAHLSAAQLEVQAGIKMLRVPYRGAQPALTDVLAGNVDMFFDTLATSVPLHRGGKLKILGGRHRSAPSGAGAADLRRGRRAGLPLDHLVRAGGAARHACRDGARSTATPSEFLQKPEMAEKLQNLSLDVDAAAARRRRQSSSPTRRRCGAR